LGGGGLARVSEVSGGSGQLSIQPSRGDQRRHALVDGPVQAGSGTAVPGGWIAWAL